MIQENVDDCSHQMNFRHISQKKGACLYLLKPAHFFKIYDEEKEMWNKNNRHVAFGHRFISTINLRISSDRQNPQTKHDYTVYSFTTKLNTFETVLKNFSFTVQ